MSDLVEDAPLAEAEQDAASWRILLRSFWTLVIGEGTARVFGLATMLLLARDLGPTGFGLAAVGMALVYRFAVVSDAGTEVLTVRNVAREPERFREIAERILGLRLALSVGATAVFVAGITLFTSSAADRAVYLRFGLALPALALNLGWIVLGIRGERSVAVGNVVGRLVFLIGVIVLVVPTDDVLNVPYAFAAGELANALVIGAAVAPRYGLLRPRVDLPYWGRTLRQSLPLMVGAFARGLTAFDLFLIAWLLGPGKAGIYSAASKPVQFAVTALSLFYISFVASYNSAPRVRARALFRRSTRASLALTVTAAAVLSIAAGAIVPFVFGGDYAAAGPVLAILAWKLPFSAVGGPYNGVLLSEGRQLLIMRNSIIGGVANVAGDLIVLPFFGVIGVAVVSVFSAALLLALNYHSAVSHDLVPSFRTVFGRAPETRPALGEHV